MGAADAKLAEPINTNMVRHELFSISNILGSFLRGSCGKIRTIIESVRNSITYEHTDFSVLKVFERPPIRLGQPLVPWAVGLPIELKVSSILMLPSVNSLALGRIIAGDHERARAFCMSTAPTAACLRGW